MDIDTYKVLISNLPVRQQCFTTKRITWKKAENELSWLKELNDELFGAQSVLKTSRQDIFETKEPRELIIKTIYWGYPGGMRGNHFVNILKNIELLENTFKKVKQINEPTTKDYHTLTNTFKEVNGLGISTYSKLFYFFQLSFNKMPCLILDQRLIDVLANETCFSNETYSKFKHLKDIQYHSAEKKYIGFLNLMNEVSKKLGTEGENIEQFLFIFGKNIKKIALL